MKDKHFINGACGIVLLLLVIGILADQITNFSDKIIIISIILAGAFILSLDKEDHEL